MDSIIPRFFSPNDKHFIALNGYTHLTRKGVVTHLGSMFVDPGTVGQITFEVFNASDTIPENKKQVKGVK